MSAAMQVAELTIKSAAVRGTVEGQYPEKGKAWTLSPGPLLVLSRPGNSVRTTATGLGKATESSVVELVEGWLCLLTGCGRNSGETRLVEELDKYFGRLNHGSNNIRELMNSIFRAKIEVRMNGNSPPGFTLDNSINHCGLSNEVKTWVRAEVKIWVKAGVKTRKTLDGTQAKREELISWQTLKILLDLRRQFTAFKGNVLNYCMTVKRIKFKLIRIKAWTLGSCLIERLNSLQACRTSRSCDRVHQVEVVDLVGVYDGKSGSPKTIGLAITNRKTVFKGNSGK